MKRLAKLGVSQLFGLFNQWFPTGFQLLRVLRRKGEGEGQLIREVVIECADRRAATRGDLGHGHGFVARFCEEPGGDIEKPGETSLGAILLRGEPG